MATGGGEFSRTLLGGHELFYEYACTLCEGEGRNVEAVKYCEECLVYLCDTCLVTKHNSFPLNRRHQLLDQGQFAATKKSAIVSFPTKRCAKHPGEHINIYCGKHDVVCCSVCRTFEHSKCQGTEHLPDAARDVSKSKEYRNIKDETTSLIFQINEVIYNGNADLSRIAKEKQLSKETIKDFRGKIKKFFDDLEKKSLDELDVKEEKITGDIKQRIEHLKKSKQEAKETMKQLESSKQGNECELFYHVITGKRFVHETQQAVQRMLDTNEEASIRFEMNEDIECYISSSLSSLRSIVESSAVKHSDVSIPTITATQQTSNASKNKKKSPDQAVTYISELYGRFDVRGTADKTCRITDICQLVDGSYLLVDSYSHKIRRLDCSFKLIDYIDISHTWASSICSIGNEEAAISLPDEKKIQFLSVGKTLKLTKTFDVGMYCYGLCQVNGKLMICCGEFDNPTSTSCIKVYNTEGRLLNTMPHTPRYLTKVPWYITASDDGQYLFVTSYNSDDITMLDMNGNIINTFCHKELRRPCGICSGGSGNLFVCGFSSDNVFQLSPLQQQMKSILTGIRHPQSIYFNRPPSLLLIGGWVSSDINVFSMKRERNDQTLQ